MEAVWVGDAINTPHSTGVGWPHEDWKLLKICFEKEVAIQMIASTQKQAKYWLYETVPFSSDLKSFFAYL